MSTKADKAWMAAVAGAGCIACRRLGLGETPAEIHHIRSNGWGRSSDRESIALCPFHHRGQEGIHHLGVKAWERQFWPQRELLEATRAEIGVKA